MEIKINGVLEKVSEGATVATLLEGRDVRPEMVAVEVNGEMVDRGRYGDHVLHADDEVEFLFYMAGG